MLAASWEAANVMAWAMLLSHLRKKYPYLFDPAVVVPQVESALADYEREMGWC